MDRHSNSVAPQTAPPASRAGIAARNDGNSDHRQNAITSGGIKAGMTMGHKNGGRSGVDSNSSTTNAVTPDAGTRTAAANTAGVAISPLTAAMITMIASRPQTMKRSIAA